jgi:SAM-dependent methyltransferase
LDEFPISRVDCRHRCRSALSQGERTLVKSATELGAVAGQYEKWVYPFPIPDLDAPDVRTRRDGGDFERNWYTFWPDRPYREDLDVLVAGCGSNAAARYAFNHRKARVTGIDLSSASLAHEAYLKDKHRLDNLALHQARIEDVSSLAQDFDFIDVSGVLHHLPDPVGGLRALAGVLRPEGTIAVMIYGQWGRTGVYMLQEMSRLLGLGQSEQDVLTVKQTLASLPKRHAIQDYVSRAPDLNYDAGLVDSFLHRQDRAYTVAQCLELVGQAGMSFMHWWENILYYPDGLLNMNQEFYRKVNAMPEASIWQFMELFNVRWGSITFASAIPTGQGAATRSISARALSWTTFRSCVARKSNPRRKCPRAAPSSNASRVRPTRSILRRRHYSGRLTARNPFGSVLSPAAWTARTPKPSARPRSSICGD